MKFSILFTPLQVLNITTVLSLLLVLLFLSTSVGDDVVY